MAKHTIWSNLRSLKVEDWKDGYIETLEINGLDIPEEIDDDDILNWARDMNDEYLNDERQNLNKVVDGRILVIADLGRWYGRVQGYKIIDSGNIADILYTECDYAEWYGDGYNIRSVGMHHDGTNYAEYRMIREDRNIENLLNDIYDGKEISRTKMNYYTKSLYPFVAAVYGW
jgi:hypothetical protein